MRYNSGGAKHIKSYEVPEAPPIQGNTFHKLVPEIRLVVPIENSYFVGTISAVDNQKNRLQQS